MPSETDLLNDALGQIGASRITAIGDGSINANHCKVFYPPLRDGMLRDHHWNFATARIELAQDAVAPAFEFSFQYTIPADSLKIREYNGASLDTTNLSLFEKSLVSRFKIEGRKLLTNDGQVKIVYTKRVTDPNEMDAMFYQALAMWLSSKLALAIAKDSKKSTDMLTQVINFLLPAAKAIDGQEGSVDPFVSDDLIVGR